VNTELSGGTGTGQLYTIKWDGNRNSRSFAPTDNFLAYAYDGANSENENLGNLIAGGEISNLRNTEMATFDNLVIKPANVTNGAISNYYFEFSAPVPTEDGDQLYIGFPSTIRTPKEPKCK
jgi:hypothetical protein